jgi:nitrate reductase NapE component
MDSQIKNKIITEFSWLLGIIIVSAALEYAIIVVFDLHPILSVKIQGFIGLVVIAYIIRMIARMGKQGIFDFEDDKQEESGKRG